MVNKGLREALRNAGAYILFDNPSFDNAIIGTTNDERVIYDYDKMVEEMVVDDNISPDEAMDFIDCNMVRTCPYIENRPIIMYGLED